MNNKKKKDLIVGSLCALGCETLFGLSYIFTISKTEVKQTLSGLETTLQQVTNKGLWQ